ncbi:uncharacterized protein TOT_020000378 [Theileria orientalis strain Shintoku]|uniref:Protein HIRA n=1 Tax=Theileria orientalis strain Shintoku TaxID=869250 RepID=J4D7D3_THEOR|nr:uncharacterized protein TOT_020000378 [Theileria orientalis strain Shintoku]PVC51127.1 hypothetical protein MACL_00001726 [Theileria orientalis]BAM40115.1 uncharacterized protein TOT_020000378 [Theileria orientalis strain Shintoku]|eukprot:XP_009690416.1 uncharacterized protein TOT_020000378 [Theileria orientalis strain Shintoku]
MRIERLNKCCGSRGNLSAVDFQPHSRQENTHRIATSGGTYVQIWAIAKTNDKLCALPVKCVLLYTFKEHSPYDVTTVRWSPNGQYLASTDSGGITNILRRNEKKTELMEKMIASKLSGDAAEIPDSLEETTKVTKYTIKYDGTEKQKSNHAGISRISLTSKSVQVESKEVKSDSLNLLDHNNLDGNMESWEALATLSCPNNMGQLFDISWAPDNRSIIGGGMNGHVIVFDIHTKEIVAKFDALENKADSASGRGYIKSVAWDPMTLFVAVQSSTKEISVWRRSPPLPPGSPVKWTFKRVLYQDHLAQASNADVLGGSRVSWAPNGKNVVFPNSSINTHEFATCYQVNHNTDSFAHALSRNGCDKNQLQYHFDMSDHSIEQEPLLLRGHAARIRNVRFSPDIMKSTLADGQGEEKYFLLAQSSDDNMLSVWRFKSVHGAATSAECVCVIKNFLDEQSSIEDLSWGDFGRCLAVASSQGGLILIQFTYEDIGAKFHTNRIQGMNLQDMSQPSEDLFSYSDQVNEARDESKSGSDKTEPELNHTSEGRYRHSGTASLNTQGRINQCVSCISKGVDISKIDESIVEGVRDYMNSGDSVGNPGEMSISVVKNPDEIRSSVNKNPGEISSGIAIMEAICKNIVTRCCKNDENVVLTVYIFGHIAYTFLLTCYRIFVCLTMYKTKLNESLAKRVKRLRTISHVCGYRVLDFFYLCNFTVESESKGNTSKKRAKGTKKMKVTQQIQQEIVHEVWLDMDYGSENALMSHYWKDTDYVPEMGQKEAHVAENRIESPINEESAEVVKARAMELASVRLERPMKIAKTNKGERSRTTRSSLSGMNVCSTGPYLNGSMFSHPVLRSSVAITVASRKVLAVNFSKTVTSVTSALCCFDESDFKIHWVQYLNRGYVTHMESLGDLVAVLAQKFDGEAGTYLSVLNVAENRTLIGQVELEVAPVSIFNTLKYTDAYLCMITTNLRLVMLKYEGEGGLRHVIDVELGTSSRDNIIKIEVVNTAKNCTVTLNEKLRSRLEKQGFQGHCARGHPGHTSELGAHTGQTNSSGGCWEQFGCEEQYLNLGDSLAFIVYKRNKTVSVFSERYEEFELTADHFEFTNNTLSTHQFNLDSLFRFYQSGSNTELFAKMDYSGSLSSVMESFGIEYEGMEAANVVGTSSGVGGNNTSSNVGGDNSNASTDATTNNTGANNCPTTNNTGANNSVGTNSSDNSNYQRGEPVQCPDGPLENHDLIRNRLKASLLIGSGWEYLLHLREYVKQLLTSGNVGEVVELAEDMYKSMLTHMEEERPTESGGNLREIRVSDVAKHPQLFQHCRNLLRCVVMPALSLVFKEITAQSQWNPDLLEEFRTLSAQVGCHYGSEQGTCHSPAKVPEFLRRISPRLDYSEHERASLPQKILVLMRNVQVWENMLKV